MKCLLVIILQTIFFSGVQNVLGSNDDDDDSSDDNDKIDTKPTN